MLSCYLNVFIPVQGCGLGAHCVLSYLITIRLRYTRPKAHFPPFLLRLCPLLLTTSFSKKRACTFWFTFLILGVLAADSPRPSCHRGPRPSSVDLTEFPAGCPSLMPGDRAAGSPRPPCLPPCCPASSSLLGGAPPAALSSLSMWHSLLAAPTPPLLPRVRLLLPPAHLPSTHLHPDVTQPLSPPGSGCLCAVSPIPRQTVPHVCLCPVPATITQALVASQPRY